MVNKPKTQGCSREECESLIPNVEHVHGSKMLFRQYMQT